MTSDDEASSGTLSHNIHMTQDVLYPNSNKLLDDPTLLRRHRKQRDAVQLLLSELPE